MNKDILFIIENEDVMLKAVFDGEKEILLFKAQNEDEIYYSIDEIENVKNGYLYIYEEDVKALDHLIQEVKNDVNLIDRIKNNQSNKLMFMYQMPQ